MPNITQKASFNIFSENVIQIESNYIKKLKIGFILDNFCDVINDMYSNICLHFLQNNDVFDAKRKASVNRIINYITNG